MGDEINKFWNLDQDGIYRVKFPKNISVENIIELMSAVMRDYLARNIPVEKFKILIDGSNVETYDTSALTIATLKVQDYITAKVAIYNISENYNNIVTDFYKTHKKLPNIEYFKNEEEARKWLEAGPIKSVLDLE